MSVSQSTGGNMLMGNGFYRLNTLLALLGSGENGYSVKELAELCDISKNIIYDDLITIMKDDSGNVAICPEEEELDEDFEYSPEFEKKLRSGHYDEVRLFAEMPFQSDLQLVLTDQEWSALSDFIRDREYDLSERSTGILIKNSVSAVSERDLLLRGRICSLIEEEKNAELEYAGKDQLIKRYFVHPVKVLHSISDNMIYLVAVVGSKTEEPMVAFYRFDRIRRISATNAEVPQTDVAAIMKKLEIAWGAELGDPVHVKLRIYDEVGVPDRIRRELGDRAEGHLRREDAYYIYEDDVIALNKFASWIRSYGASIVVLEPEELRERMIRSAKERLEYYTEKTVV